MLKHDSYNLCCLKITYIAISSGKLVLQSHLSLGSYVLHLKQSFKPHCETVLGSVMIWKRMALIGLSECLVSCWWNYLERIRWYGFVKVVSVGAGFDISKAHNIPSLGLLGSCLWIKIQILSYCSSSIPSCMWPCSSSW